MGAGVVTGGEVVGAEVVLSANVVPGAGVPPFPPDPESELLPPPQAASSPLVIAANVKARLALFTGEITEATAGFSISTRSSRFLLAVSQYPSQRAPLTAWSFRSVLHDEPPGE